MVKLFYSTWVAIIQLSYLHDENNLVNARTLLPLFQVLGVSVQLPCLRGCVAHVAPGRFRWSRSRPVPGGARTCLRGVPGPHSCEPWEPGKPISSSVSGWSQLHRPGERCSQDALSTQWRSVVLPVKFLCAQTLIEEGVPAGGQGSGAQGTACEGALWL